MHGEEASNRALKAAHTEVLSTVLRTPISDLVEDLRESSQSSRKTAGAYVEDVYKRQVWIAFLMSAGESFSEIARSASLGTSCLLYTSRCV